MSISFYAADGLLWGEKDINVVKTEWFDIIYPAREEPSAKLLYENADRIYYEIAEDYGFPPHARMPVVLVPSVEEFNAFWSWMPYNHIVIYDTESIEQLEVFSEKLLSTFKHELTHAYTYNLENGFWRGVSSVLGDAVVLGRVFTTVGMAESATLTSESNKGEGRLNDEYSKQMVKQAKLEDKFPQYYDMQGAATNYPAGAFYYFNGAFAQWLQKNYGMEKYALYWYKCINFQTLTPGMAFKKAFGESFSKAWEKFKKDVEVPEIPGNPVEAEIVQDFFNQNENVYSAKNNGGSLYTSLSVSDNGFIYIDEKTSSVYFVNSSDYENTKIKPEKLFYYQGLDTAAISRDGKLIAFSYYDFASSVTKHKTALYDVKSKKIFHIDESNSFKPSIVQKNDEYFLLNVGYKSPVSSISISKINFKNNRIDSVSFLSQYELDINDTVNSFTDIGDGEFAFVKMEGIEHSICIWNLDGKEISRYKAPAERMFIRYLEPCESGLMFSWVKPGTMPRLGMLDLESEQFILSEKDISGGVYYPVELGSSGKIAYTGNFFRENRLFVTKNEILKNNTSVFAAETVPEASEEKEEIFEIEKKADTSLAFSPEPFNVFPYLLKGVWLPVSIVTSPSSVPGGSASYALPYGITHITGTPWFSSSGLLIASLGYGEITNSVGLDVSYKGGTEGQLLNYTVEAMAEVDLSGFKLASGTIDLSSTIHFGSSSMLGLSAYSFAQFGKANKDNSISYDSEIDSSDLLQILFPFGTGAPATQDNYLTAINGIGVGYGNFWKAGPGRFEKAGFSLFANGAWYLIEKLTGQKEVYKDQVDIGATLRVYIPKLIPVTCKNGYCYNLPLSLSAHLYPTGFDSAFGGNQSIVNTLSDLFAYDIVYSVNAETILFAMDVQKGIWCTPLFVNDFRISLAYTGVFLDPVVTTSSWKILKTKEYINSFINDERFIYGDIFRLKAVVGLTPNFGASANSNFKEDIYFEFTLHQTLPGSYSFLCSIGIDLGF